LTMETSTAESQGRQETMSGEVKTQDSGRKKERSASRSPSRMNGPTSRGSRPNRPPGAQMDAQSCPYPYRKAAISGCSLPLYLIRARRRLFSSRGFPRRRANSPPVPRAIEKTCACDLFCHKPSSPRHMGFYRLLVSLIPHLLVNSTFTSSRSQRSLDALPYLIRVGV